MKSWSVPRCAACGEQWHAGRETLLLTYPPQVDVCNGHKMVVVLIDVQCPARMRRFGRNGKLKDEDNRPIQVYVENAHQTDV